MTSVTGTCTSSKPLQCTAALRNLEQCKRTASMVVRLLAYRRLTDQEFIGQKIINKNGASIKPRKFHDLDFPLCKQHQKTAPKWYKIKVD